VQLQLRNFRNHRATRLAPGQAAFVVLTGENGAGKTNILEAVSLLSVGRGLRGARLSQMAAQYGDGGFELLADLLPDAGLPPVHVHSFTRPAAPERRQLRVNDAPARLSVLTDWSSQLWLTPAMDRLFADTASARRRFLDRLVLALQPAHGRHASRFDAAMRARNRLLQGDAPPDPAWLDALEAEMARHGAALADARQMTVHLLEEQLRAAADGAFPRPSVSLQGGDVPEPESADATTLQQLFRQLRRADQAAGRTTAGPHRVDLQVVHADKAMPAAQASTGEQKALLIAILLAHAALVAGRSGRRPLLLLDEVAAHLDCGRRQALFDSIAALGGQAWLTGTDPALFQTLDAARFSVSAGQVARG
jgi:DNA replication and repair protein RecF